MSARISGYISTGQHELHYTSFGAGRKLLFAFHGYGDNAGFFMPFVEYLQRDYTVISIDLPHHGKCEWPAGKYLQTEDLMVVINSFREEFDAKKIALAGYSIGGRICLKIIEQAPQIIERTVLMAPDGLVSNRLYHFVTRNLVGKKLFQNLLSNPDPYFKWMEFAKNKNWVSEARYKLAMRYLESADSRNFLLKVWPCLSHIVPDTNKVRKTIKEYRLPVTIFMGRHDVVIPVSQAKSFCKELDTVQLHVLDKAHRLLDTETIPQIAESLL